MSGSSKRGSKKPRFFCESCGNEVPLDAENCPKCGSCFASVRCPACGFTGEEAFFKGGCPECGYSTSDNAKEIIQERKAAGVLPLWVYIFTGIAFTAVLVIFFMRVLA